MGRYRAYAYYNTSQERKALVSDQPLLFNFTFSNSRSGRLRELGLAVNAVFDQRYLTLPVASPNEAWEHCQTTYVKRGCKACPIRSFSLHD